MPDDDPQSSTEGSGSIDDLLRAVAATEPSPAFVNVPKFVGRYRVGARLGRGGLGVVHAGSDPSLHREVAIKFVRPDRTGARGGSRLQARLHREAQTVARLSHPHVVQIFDVGEVDGQVYIAMERIHGPTLRQWVEARPRPSAEIVAAYRAAAEGLAAAHAVGVVHRDFKPDNALVDRGGRVVVVDFGIARELEGASSASGESTPESGRLTQSGAFVGTRGYAAPEQLAGEPATEKSDQYSFCVALFEALAGGRPQTPAADPARIDAKLRSVLRRGMALDPNDRWSTMAELLGALGSARAPTRTIAAVLFVAMALVAAAVGIRAWFLTRARELCEDDVRRSWDVENELATMQETFAASGVAGAGPASEDTTAALRAYAAEAASLGTAACRAEPPLREPIRRCFDDRRLWLRSLTVALREELDVDAVHGAVQAAAVLPPLRRCVEEARLSRPASDRRGPDAAYEKAVRAFLLDELGRGDEAAALARTVLGDLHAGDRAHAMALLVIATYTEGSQQEAAASLEHAYTAALASNDDEIAIDAAIRLVRLIGFELERFDQARTWGDRAKSLLEGTGADPIREGDRLLALAQVDNLARDSEVALRRLEAARIAYRTVLDARHPRLIQLDSVNAAIHSLAGNFGRARSILEPLYARSEAEFGSAHPLSSALAHGLSRVATLEGDFERAEAYAARAFAIDEAIRGPGHPETASSRQALGETYLDRGRADEALPLLERALADLERAHGPEHIAVARALNPYAVALSRTGHPDRALEALHRALTSYEVVLGAEHPETIAVRHNLADAAIETGDLAGAREQLQQVVRLSERVSGPDHPGTADAYHMLGYASNQAGDTAAALTAYESGLRIMERAVGRDHARVAEFLIELGSIRAKDGRFSEALPELERCLVIQLATDAPATVVARTRSVLARVLRASGGDPARARELAELARADYVRGGEAFLHDVESIDRFLDGTR